MRLAPVAVASALAAAWSAMAFGHPMPNSTVLVSAVPAGFDAEVSIPLSELGAALGVPVREGQADDAALRRYILGHAAIADQNGRRWPAQITRLDFDNIQRGTLVVSLSFKAPVAADRSGATLRYDVVTHSVASHNVLVYFREEPEADARPLVRLQAPTTTLALKFR